MKQVKLVEVGPRDGLQNESRILSLEDKFLYVQKLVASGFGVIETTSFVRAEKIPQMKDAEELIQLIQRKFGSRKDVFFPCLVPNQKGLARALKVGVQDVALFTATSETFNQKNIGMSVDESCAEMGRVLDDLKSVKPRYLRGYISTAFGCPYEGKTSIEVLRKLVRFFLERNVQEVSIGDTIGVANPRQVREILQVLIPEFGKEKLALHFHDTRGLAVANIAAAWEAGIRVFDASSAGLGGCPYAAGASGNVATEDVCYLFESMGVKTGIDFEQLAAASSFVLSKLEKTGSSKALNAYLANPQQWKKNLQGVGDCV